MSARPALTRADYARAEAFLPWNVEQLVLRAGVEPRWIGDSDRFWYRVQTAEGPEFVLVDPASGTRRPAFDHARLAAALSRASDARSRHTRATLPFQAIELLDDDATLRFDIGDARWTCDLTDYACVREDKPAEPAEAESRSPDGAWAVFVRDHNLWLRRVADGAETRLTDDGEPFYDYATPPEGRTTAVTQRLTGQRPPPSGAWSPDSARFATHRVDQRHVPELHLLQSAHSEGGRPKLHAYRYALPEDERLPEAALCVVDIAARSVTPIQTPPLVAGAFSPFDLNQVWWADAAGSAAVCFLAYTRDNRRVTLSVADAASGACREVLTDSSPTHLAPPLLPTASRGLAWLAPDRSEAVWFSERDGWGHLYLHDGQSGAELGQITRGEWVVRELVRVDHAQRMVYFTAGGRERGRDPYYRHLYRANFDGSGLELLTPEDADHAITPTPSGAWLVDVYSRVDLPPVAVVRDLNGRVVVELETADISRLLAAGWRFPERVQARAADGVTDIYGVLIYPARFDPARRYPALDAIYPGPQITRAPKAFPGVGPREGFWHDQSLAELGFVVVTVDGRGTPFRSKAFHDAQYAKLELAGGLDDHIAALRQLALTRPWLDLDRVGIYGHSGGGFASARAMLAYPEFYTVAVSSAGNHDQRGYLATWGERYIGPLAEGNYAKQVNASLAGNLAGKLLLVWGELDDNVHPAMTLQLIDALIKANKDVDLLVLPNCNHAFADLSLGGRDQFGTSANNLYFLRRRWDYFVTHLLGADPPREYRIQEPEG